MAKFTITYVLFNIIVNFVIQKLKNKQKVYKLSKAKLTEREETKTRYFARMCSFINVGLLF